MASIDLYHSCFCVYILKMYIKAQKHVCFHVFSPFSAHLTDKGLLFVILAPGMIQNNNF